MHYIKYNACNFHSLMHQLVNEVHSTNDLQLNGFKENINTMWQHKEFVQTHMVMMATINSNK
jgi:hypothetical protein